MSNKAKNWLKIFAGTLLMAVLISLLSLSAYNPTDSQEIRWGINFSHKHAAYLSEFWPEMYEAILDELKPSRLRLMAYWDVIEPKKNRFDFAAIDYMLQEAGTRDIDVILVLGRKQPRWPECHEPAWYHELSKTARDEAALIMLARAVDHFKQFQNIKAWQIENEPFFPFGPECPIISWGLFQKELQTVRKLDSRPIVVTDSGEKGLWLPAAWAGADIFGSTMYRTVYHDRRERYITYAITPEIYKLRSGSLKLLSGTDRVVGVELQAEPWFITDMFQTPISEQLRLMNKTVFKQNVDYARRVGFSENYFWGTEWWYWLKEKGHPEMWEAAQKVIN